MWTVVTRAIGVVSAVGVLVCGVVLVVFSATVRECPTGTYVESGSPGCSGLTKSCDMPGYWWVLADAKKPEVDMEMVAGMVVLGIGAFLTVKYVVRPLGLMMGAFLSCCSLLCARQILAAENTYSCPYPPHVVLFDSYYCATTNVSYTDAHYDFGCMPREELPWTENDDVRRTAGALLVFLAITMASMTVYFFSYTTPNTNTNDDTNDPHKPLIDGEKPEKTLDV